MNCRQIYKIASIFCALANSKLHISVADNATKKKANEEEVPITDSDLQEARWLLLSYLSSIESEAVEMASNRYEFILTGATESYWRPGEIKYDFFIAPKGRESGATSESEFGTPRTTYKTPQEAIESIPQDNNYAYRGMSYEEFAASMRRGTIKSRGGYNLIKSQEGLTFFSPEAGAAQSYAGGFAPWRYGPTHNRPGVVIGIDKDWLTTPEEHPLGHEAIPEGELALQDEISTSVIDYIYYIIPVDIEWGKLTLSKEKQYDSKAGEYKYVPSVSMASSPTKYEYGILQVK